MAENQHGNWFLGIDLGTGSCKSVIIDAQARPLGSGTGDYSKRETRGQWEEQDPQESISALIQSVRAAIQNAGVKPSACQSLSIGGAYHSLIALDKSGLPLTGVITWVDRRATKQAQAVRDAQRAGEIYQQTGCPVHSMYPLYKLIWLREEQPHIFKEAVRFVSAKEYVVQQLTGEYLLDVGVAGATGLLNTRSLTWNDASLELAGVRPDQLSPLAGPRQVLRSLDAELAAQMGIPRQTPLILGSADAVNSSLGAGAVLPGLATCMIGTSGGFRIIARHPMLDEQARSWCYAIDDEHWLVGGAINNAGLALTWLRDAFNRLLQAGANPARLSFDDLITSASQVPPGAGGLICLPFFAGERSPNWNMDARGVFFGLNLDHDARHIVRALIEGVAFRLRSVRDVLVELGADVRQIRASGGYTHSELWPQIIASALNQALASPAWGETSSMGAAFWAMIGSGVVQRFEDLHTLAPITKTHNPDPGEASLYDSLYQIYLDLYSRLGESFTDLSALQQDDPYKS